MQPLIGHTRRLVREEVAYNLRVARNIRRQMPEIPVDAHLDIARQLKTTGDLDATRQYFEERAKECGPMSPYTYAALAVLSIQAELARYSKELEYLRAN